VRPPTCLYEMTRSEMHGSLAVDVVLTCRNPNALDLTKGWYSSSDLGVAAICCSLAFCFDGLRGVGSLVASGSPAIFKVTASGDRSIIRCSSSEAGKVRIWRMPAYVASGRAR